ncbi:MAG: hypothetical protein RMJ82_12445 [Gemmatales bacterium]|nr:hypothetical protein [Gemmatales bacterium]
MLDTHAADPIAEWAVVKLGGSLLDLPGLVSKLAHWLNSMARPSVLVVGGGGLVDWLRHMDALHGLPCALTHELAIEMMRCNARWLTAMLPQAVLVSDFTTCQRAWRNHGQPVLDPVTFCRHDSDLADALPVGWQVTSDSIAAQLAWRWRAAELVLLKSCHPPCHDWQRLAELGLIDAHFPSIAHRLSVIRWVCWRDEPVNTA